MKLDSFGAMVTVLCLFAGITEPAFAHGICLEGSLWRPPAPVFFGVGNARLTAEALNQIETLATVLQSSRRIHLTISGYADPSGSRAYNERLSRRRADAVKERLVAHGIQPDRIEIIAYGEDDPAFPEGVHPDARFARRVDFVAWVAGSLMLEGCSDGQIALQLRSVPTMPFERLQAFAVQLEAARERGPGSAETFTLSFDSPEPALHTPFGFELDLRKAVPEARCVRVTVTVAPEDFRYWPVLLLGDGRYAFASDFDSERRP